MERFEPGFLIKLSHDLALLASSSNAISEQVRHTFRTNLIPTALGHFAVTFGRLGLRVSSEQAHDLHNMLHANPAYDIAPRLNILIETVEKEMRAQCFLEIRPDLLELFRQSKPLFGLKFNSNNFSSALYDLAEAGKCLAFERTTAAVFHLMRLMEIGLRATARCLGIPDPIKARERNWAVILEKIRTQIDAKWPASTRLRGDGVLFENIYTSLDAVKNSWRNSTMHVERTYTEEEAMHVFHAVKGFMSKVAERMDENGSPKA